MLNLKPLKVLLEKAETSTSSPIRIVTLTGYKKIQSPLHELLEKYAKNKQNLEVLSFIINNIDIIEKDTSYNLYDRKGDTYYKISPDDTIFIMRKGILKNLHTQSLGRKLESLNFYTINPIQSMLDCDNKYLTYLKLVEKNLSTPKTVLISSENRVLETVEKLGGKYPLVMKILDGTQGRGVSIVESEKSLMSVYQTLKAISPNIEVVLQEMIEADYDLRIHVIKKHERVIEDPQKHRDHYEIIAVMKRNKIKGDFRTNYALGGTIDFIDAKDLDPEIVNLAIDSAPTLGCYWSGVDIIIDKEGKGYVLELNTSPGSKGIYQTNKGIIKVLVDWMTNKLNWIPAIKEVGYLEKITITGIGELVAKFDTGNGSMSPSLSCEEIDVIDNKVIWKLGEKEFESELGGTHEVSVGTEIQQSPVIRVDIEFAGRKYEGMEFCLVDRTEKSTPILVNRKLMRILGLSVDSMEKFKIEDFRDERTGKKFSSKRALKDPYGGINFK